MKLLFLIFVMISSTFAVAYFGISFHQENEAILVHTMTQNPLATTNHNWSNQ